MITAFHPLLEDVFQYFVSNYDIFCATQASAFLTFALLQLYGVYFISCTRRLNWEGHLNTLEKITPWLLSYDRVNYSRSVPVYLHEMRKFEKTHPFAREHLRAGEFAIQHQDRFGFVATAADQVIEQTV